MALFRFPSTVTVTLSYPFGKKEATYLEMADLHVQRERVEHHGADEGDARRHGVHYLEFAARKGLLAGDLFGSSQFDSYSIVEMFIGRRRQH